MKIEDKVITIIEKHFDVPLGPNAFIKAEAGISWNGFNLYGDLKSIQEVQRLMHVEARYQYFVREGVIK
jgi:hypothetical protein